MQAGDLQGAVRAWPAPGHGGSEPDAQADFEFSVAGEQVRPRMQMGNRRCMEGDEPCGVCGIDAEALFLCRVGVGEQFGSVQDQAA
ncbi:hypothetical protein D9M68_801060 [compost metagenome]